MTRKKTEKKQKTIMESFRIDEISGVDRPAQEGARALLIKRAEDPVVKDGEELPVGSFEIKDIDDLRNAIKGLDPSTKEGPVVKYIERRAMALGAEQELKALKSVNGDMQKEHETMTDKKKKTVDNDAVEKQLQESQDALAIAKAYGELNDAEKSLYAKMNSDEQAAFLKLDADGRKSAVEKAAGENPVVYTDLEGNEYRKSDDPRAVSAAKRADNAEKIAKEEREKREDADLAKRAEDGMQNLPGELDVKKAVLKAVDGISDAKLREGALALLKAGNENLADAFKKRGENGEPESSSLEAEYEKAAEEYAKEKDVDLVTAKAEVLTESAKGRDIAKRMEEERRAEGR